MSNMESFTEVMKSDDGVAIFGIGAIALIVGGHYLAKGRYRVEAKQEGLTVEPAAEQKKQPSASAPATVPDPRPMMQTEQ